jgi:hypothetical protein
MQRIVERVMTPTIGDLGSVGVLSWRIKWKATAI